MFLGRDQSTHDNMFKSQANVSVYRSLPENLCGLHWTSVPGEKALIKHTDLTEEAGTIAQKKNWVKAKFGALGDFIYKCSNEQRNQRIRCVYPVTQLWVRAGTLEWLEDPDVGWGKNSSAQGTPASCTGKVFSCPAPTILLACIPLHKTLILCFQWFLIQERIKRAWTYTEVPWKQRGKLRNQCQSKENYFSALGSNAVVLLFPPLLRAVCSRATLWVSRALCHCQDNAAQSHLTALHTCHLSASLCFYHNLHQPRKPWVELKSHQGQGPRTAWRLGHVIIPRESDLQEPLTGWEETTSSCSMGGLD